MVLDHIATGADGGTLPAVMNAANEVAVAAFIDRRCAFPAIWKTVEAVMRAHTTKPRASLAEILDSDSLARARAAVWRPTRRRA